MTHILSGLLNGLSDAVVAGDQYTYVGLAAAARAVSSYRTGKRDTENTLEFIHDLRERVIGAPEINTDGFHPYKAAIRDVLAGGVSHGVIAKTCSVTNLAVKEAARRYSPAEVVAVEREVVSGLPANISTSYVERSNLTLRMSSKRFARLSNGFSRRLENHVHESLRSTPAMALGVAERVWTDFRSGGRCARHVANHAQDNLAGPAQAAHGSRRRKKLG